jgi:hypothetical protein
MYWIVSDNLNVQYGSSGSYGYQKTGYTLRIGSQSIRIVRIFRLIKFLRMVKYLQTTQLDKSINGRSTRKQIDDRALVQLRAKSSTKPGKLMSKGSEKLSGKGAMAVPGALVRAASRKLKLTTADDEEDEDDVPEKSRLGAAMTELMNQR